MPLRRSGLIAQRLHRSTASSLNAHRVGPNSNQRLLCKPLRSAFLYLSAMLQRLRRLLLGIILIVAASAVLVLTDKSGSRTAQNAARSAKSTRIAIIQLTNIAAFETGKAGLLAYLASVGYSAPNGCVIETFNASGDMATLAQICAQVGSSTHYDLVISLGTACTQSFVRTNTRCIPHVIGIVASPPAIGIPLGPYTEKSDRPACCAGFGTLQPIEQLFRILVACAPDAKRVGVVWNPAEPNSEVSVKLGRIACAQLGLELIEANGGNVSDVTHSAEAVLSSGVDAFWMLPDVQVSSAANIIIDRCNKAQVPAITNLPELGARGGAINIGADWATIGATTGLFAELLLRGVDATALPMENFTPAIITIDTNAVPKSWTLSQQLLESATEIYTAGKPPEIKKLAFPLAPESALITLAALNQKRATTATPPAQLPAIALFTYNRTPNFEDCYAGFAAEWARLGYIDGKNCKMSLRDAQFDSGTLNTIASAIAEERPDVVVPFTTPALQASMRHITDTAIVFTLVSSGVVVGAGTSNTDHLPFVTGSQVTSDWDKMLEVARVAIPDLRRVGTIYSPGESNSVHFHALWKAKLAAAGIELVSVGADKPTEVPEAADALASMGIQAIMQISDNASSTGFRSITKAADRANIPVFGFSPTALHYGATIVVARDYRDVGRLAAQLVDRVLKGESPAKIPFVDPDTTVIAVNPERLTRFGITLTKSILDIAKIDGEKNEAAKETASDKTGVKKP